MQVKHKCAVKYFGEKVVSKIYSKVKLKKGCTVFLCHRSTNESNFNIFVLSQKRYEKALLCNEIANGSNLFI